MNTHTIPKGVRNCDVLPLCFRSVSQATFPGDETNPCHSIPRDCRESENKRLTLGQRLEIVAVQASSSLKLEGHIATTKDSDYRQAFDFRPKILNKLNPLTKDVPLTLVTLTSFFWVERPIRCFSSTQPPIRYCGLRSCLGVLMAHSCSN